MKFETLEKAQKAFDDLNKKHEDEVKAHAATKGKLEKAETKVNDEVTSHNTTKNNLKEAQGKLSSEESAHAKTKDELKTAQEIAEDAVSKANEAIEKSDPNVYVDFDRARYRINFGVNGKTKEEVRDDKSLVSKLVKNGSGALTKV